MSVRVCAISSGMQSMSVRHPLSKKQLHAGECQCLAPHSMLCLHCFKNCACTPQHLQCYSSLRLCNAGARLHPRQCLAAAALRLRLGLLLQRVLQFPVYDLMVISAVSFAVSAAEI